jgi:hypothetical protein
MPLFVQVPTTATECREPPEQVSIAMYRQAVQAVEIVWRFFFPRARTTASAIDIAPVSTHNGPMVKGTDTATGDRAVTQGRPL